MNKKLEVVDFMRGFAIFTIALMHLVQRNLSGVLNKAVAFGGAGVHMFILVSGFGLYLSYRKKPLGYLAFLKKRFGKVYWPYAVAVLLWGGWALLRSAAFPMKEVASHLLLYKMFSSELDVSLCYPFWFISTIIQFYICWPLIVRLVRVGGGNTSVSGYGLLISGWATVVGMLGYEDMRPWGSCFLQYLWEFVLGMWLADKYASSSSKVNALLEDPKNLKWWWLIGGVVVGMSLTGFMGWNGGILKLYNDIPSIVAYLSCLLIVYKLGLKFVNKFFVWASGFGYELYLVHSLVYVVMGCLLKSILPLPIWIVMTFIIAYAIAWLYSWLLKRTIYRK